MPENPIPFAPRITGEAPNQFYDDNRIHGAVESGVLPDGRTFLRIDEWTSSIPGCGYSNEALLWLRARHDAITANGVGEVEDGVGDIATMYWVHQQEKGLVDVLLLDDGTELKPGMLVGVPTKPGFRRACP